MKMADHLIPYSTFDVKHDGKISFLINQKIGVNKFMNDSIFSRRDL